MLTIPSILTQVTERLARHGSGTHGYSVANLQELVWTETEGNWIVLPRGVTLGPSTKLRFHGYHGNVVIIGRDSSLGLDINFHGNNNIATFGGRSVWAGGCSAYMRGSDQLLFVGAQCAINSAMFLVVGDKSKITIGDGCMFAFGVSIRTHDEHGIVDLTTGTVLNPASDVKLEPHVWLGKDASVHKGVKIGFGSVIGERSIVTKSIGRRSIAVGAPARVTRKNVTWDISMNPQVSKLGLVNDYELGLGPFSASVD